VADHHHRPFLAQDLSTVLPAVYAQRAATVRAITIARRAFPRPSEDFQRRLAHLVDSSKSVKPDNTSAKRWIINSWTLLIAFASSAGYRRAARRKMVERILDP